ncbi:HK97 gp10 family phage protein [Cytobacillus horneckiae]|uniref:HK97 gp10 family phage protein n=1 Tax=Cytobacillus horneckiae TaxID=549687 RepID=UPI0034CE9BE3
MSRRSSGNSRMFVTVDIDGIGPTVVRIDRFSEDIKKELKKITRQTTNRTRKDMKAEAPVGPTGNLKASVRAKYFEGGLSSTVVPRKPKGSHRHIVSYGTQRRRTKSGANRGVMPANPAMANVERNHEAFYQNKVKELIERDVTI